MTIHPKQSQQQQQQSSQQEQYSSSCNTSSSSTSRRIIRKREGNTYRRTTTTTSSKIPSFVCSFIFVWILSLLNCGGCSGVLGFQVIAEKHYSYSNSMLRAAASSATTTTTTTALHMMKMKLRVVSYNVLSSHLAEPSHFSTLNPDHLEASKRLPVILQKLRQEIENSNNDNNDNNSNPLPTVFALQEVSYDWSGAFHTFFANHGYHFVTGLYGKKFNGYMGIGLAWPIHTFTCLETNIARLSDHRIDGWPKQKENESYFWKTWIETPLQKLGWMESKPECHWHMSERRNNVIVGATLQHKETGTQVCIANYHMPCAFYAPKTMTLHSEMAVRYVQEMAKKNNNDNDNKSIPYILAGDFNLKPIDSAYTYLTTGNLDPNDPFYPTPPEHDPTFTWKPSLLEPVRSAYAVANNNKEPDFTNYARIRENDPFIDTLDYIFISPTTTSSSSSSIQVSAVHPLPHREDANGPFPNLDVNEPSDHILIAANLEIEN